MCIIYIYIVNWKLLATVEETKIKSFIRWKLVSQVADLKKLKSTMQFHGSYSSKEVAKEEKKQTQKYIIIHY